MIKLTEKELKELKELGQLKDQIFQQVDNLLQEHRVQSFNWWDAIYKKHKLSKEQSFNIVSNKKGVFLNEKKKK